MASKLLSNLLFNIHVAVVDMGESVCVGVCWLCQAVGEGCVHRLCIHVPVYVSHKSVYALFSDHT